MLSRLKQWLTRWTGVLRDSLARRRRPQLAFSRQELQAFIAQYSTRDEKQIRFDWNGKRGELFEDGNDAFRQELMREVVADLHAVPMELVRDLFLAETAYSREARAIDRRVRLLAEHLLVVGGDGYLDDYLAGKWQSFDSSLMAGSISLSLPQVEHFLGLIRQRLKTEQDPLRITRLQAGEQVFAGWKESLRNQV